MNLKSWADIDQVLKDTGAQRFNVGRSRDFQSNDNVFIYDKDKSFAENKEICERLLDRAAGETLYLTIWRSENSRTAGCQYYVRYDAPAQPIQLPASGVSGGLYGTGDKIQIDELTRDIEQRLLNRFEKERLERESKQLAEERKEFESAKNSALGLIASYVAPFAKQLAGRLPQVAGIDADAPVHVAPIHAKRQQQEPGEQPADAPSVQPKEDEQGVYTEEEDVFTDAESETLYALMARFKAIEPGYLKLIAAVVEMAERGDATYTMAKGFLMK